MKHIVFLTKTSGHGGVEFHLMELIKRFDYKNFRVSVICFNNNSFFQCQRQDNKILSYLNMLSIPEPRNIVSFLFFIKKIKPDILVFVKGSFKLFPWWMYLSCFISGKFNTYAIEHQFPSTVTGYEKLNKKNGLRYLYKRTLGWYGRDKISGWLQSLGLKKTICVANTISNCLIKYFHYSPAKVVTIHNGVNINQTNHDNLLLKLELKKKLGVRDTEKIIVCTARLSSEKGITFLLHAVRILKNEYPLFKLIIIGNGPLEKKLKEIASSFGLSSNVIFVGFQKDVFSFLQIAHIFVLSSRKEGLPFSILEAMSFALPCVVTDVGGNREAVVDNENGYIVKFGDKYQLVNRLKYLLENDAIREKSGRIGRERANLFFNIEKNMREIITIICDHN